MARRKTQTRRAVAVDWYDARGHTGWVDRQEAEQMKAPLCTTVGFIIKHTKTELVIAGTIGHGADDSVGGVDTIPAGMVGRIAPLGDVVVFEEGQEVSKAPVDSRRTGKARRPN